MAPASYFDTPELVSRIASNITSSESSVATYSPISRQWRLAIEPYTFSATHLSPSRLSDFASFVKGVRRGAVHQIQFVIVLDTYSTISEARLRPPKTLTMN